MLLGSAASVTDVEWVVRIVGDFDSITRRTRARVAWGCK